MYDSFKEAPHTPIKCGIAVEWRLKTYILVHTDDIWAYLLDICEESAGEKFKVSLNEIRKSRCKVTFYM